MSLFMKKSSNILGTMVGLAMVFLYMVYPWLGHTEGHFLPVFDQHQTYYSRINNMVYIGGGLVSQRSCELHSVSIINVVENVPEELWSRNATTVPVTYSDQTRLGYGPFEFDFNYFGFDIGELYVRTRSKCHMFYYTYNTYRIN